MKLEEEQCVVAGQIAVNIKKNRLYLRVGKRRHEVFQLFGRGLHVVNRLGSNILDRERFR